MIFSNYKNLQDYILEALLGGPMQVNDLCEYLYNKKSPATVQGVYKILREYIKQDVVVKQKKTYQVNNVWKNRLLTTIASDTKITISEGEQLIYKFSKIDHLDMFWKHSVETIGLETRGFPVFFSEAHSFWYYVPGRAQSEIEYFNSFLRDKVHAFNMIGGKTLLDRNKKKFSNEYLQINLTDSYPFNRREHFSVIGPYIITTRVSQSLVRATDYAYTIARTEEELSELLLPKFKKPGPIIMTVEHNIEKAKKLRKRMAKDFYIPREVREQFELF